MPFKSAARAPNLASVSGTACCSAFCLGAAIFPATWILARGELATVDEADVVSDGTLGVGGLSKFGDVSDCVFPTEMVETDAISLISLDAEYDAT